MRPGNFPTLRLAQLAMLVHSQPQLFAAARDGASLEQWRTMFRVAASEYWDDHYRIGEYSPSRKKWTGQQFIDNLVINTVIPFLMAYQIHQGKEHGLASVLEGLPAEQNLTIRAFRQAGIASHHCGHGQALLELKKSWCDQLRCLDCALGIHQLFRRSSRQPFR
jgi:hypothetical protein